VERVTPPALSTAEETLTEERAADWRRLRAAYATSTLGSFTAYGAIPMVAVLALHASALQVTLISAIPMLAAAVVALPFGATVEGRTKRPVMVLADLTCALCLLSLPVASWLGVIGVWQLVGAMAVVTLAQIAFTAASGANLKALVGSGPGLTRANADLEQITWTSITIGPLVGGALVSAVGPFLTVAIDAVSYLGSAFGVGRMRSPEPTPVVPARTHPLADATAGLRHIWSNRMLRSLWLNSLLFSGGVGIVIALESFYALSVLHFAPWEYGLVVGGPAVAGIVGTRLAVRLTRRFGDRRVLLLTGALRTPWVLLLAFLPVGTPGVVGWLALLTAELLVVGVFNPTFATARMRATADDHMARVGATWMIARRLTAPVFVLLGGALATTVSPRAAIAVAGVLVILSCALLPWRASAG
jgi:hypothetical protein